MIQNSNFKPSLLLQNFWLNHGVLKFTQQLVYNYSFCTLLDIKDNCGASTKIQRTVDIAITHFFIINVQNLNPNLLVIKYLDACLESLNFKQNKLTDRLFLVCTSIKATPKHVLTYLFLQYQEITIQSRTVNWVTIAKINFFSKGHCK